MGLSPSAFANLMLCASTAYYVQYLRTTSVGVCPGEPANGDAADAVPPTLPIVAPPPIMARKPPPLPQEDDDDDHEILCDCGWTRIPGQSCEETRGKPDFGCWPHCCSDTVESLQSEA